MGWVRHLNNDHIGVRVRHIHGRKTFMLDPDENEPICVVKAGTEVVEMTDGETVVLPDGNEIPATGRYFRTTETIDPYHIVLDVVDPVVIW